MKDVIYSGAELSPDRVYRYSLIRRWEEEENHALVMFIGLNPSTADATKDDPTIRRCKQFAYDWGYAGICMMNLFAYRATKRSDMKNAVDPIGAENNRRLMTQFNKSGLVVAAWGADGKYQDRDLQVLDLLSYRDIYCLGKTNNGSPGHPLYIKADKPLELFRKSVGY